jgi:hypothetical protein
MSMKIEIKRASRITVSEKALQNAASRLLPKGGRLIGPEVAYLRKHLGHTATQAQIDEQVVAVRRLPWSSLVVE